MTKNYHHLLVLLQQLNSEDHLIVWFRRFFIFSCIVCTCSCYSSIDFNIHSRRLLRRAAGRNCATITWTLNWLYYWGYMPWQICTVYSLWNLIPFPRRTYNIRKIQLAQTNLRKNIWTRLVQMFFLVKVIYNKIVFCSSLLNQKQDLFGGEPKVVNLFNPSPTNSLKALLVPSTWFSLSCHQKHKCKPFNTESLESGKWKKINIQKPLQKWSYLIASLLLS